MSRMSEERDFDAINPVFFSTSQHGQAAPAFAGKQQGTLQDAFDIEALRALDIIITCQGGDYTSAGHQHGADHTAPTNKTYILHVVSV